ncbi:hypothetical protein LCGC14_1677460 [marine sediment metagenome]|uniref:Uncharacterized protein n=1 Tax=marine sediment metagenome TaxID=412755 RepID=A0A0F9HQ29_9ZZZZ
MNRMLSEREIALVDMDGTLCDYESALNAKMKEVLGDDVCTWDPKYDKLRDLIKAQPGFWRDLEPIAFGMEVFTALQDVGFEIHILTKGPYRTTISWAEKVEWCRRWVPGTPVTITENKGMVYGKVLFDDYPDYCEAWMKWRPRGLVIMPAYDHNKEFAENHSNQVLRCTAADMDKIKDTISLAYDRVPNGPLSYLGLGKEN